AANAHETVRKTRRTRRRRRIPRLGFRCLRYRHYAACGWRVPRQRRESVGNSHKKAQTHKFSVPFVPLCGDSLFRPLHDLDVFIVCPSMPNRKTASSPYKVQVLDRSLAIIDALANVRDDASLAELAEKVKLHKSTVHRLTSILERHRIVERDTRSGRYCLGL